jgi:hypothetical protein
VLFQPWPQRLCAHPVDARGTGVVLDASERLDEVLAGEKPLPQARRSGVRPGLVRRRGAAALWLATLRLHRRVLPPRPLAGLAALNAVLTSLYVLGLRIAFGPSQRLRSPPVLWPLLIARWCAIASRPSRSHPTRRTRSHPGSKVLLGGLSSTYYHEELIQNPNIDFVIRGDSTEEPCRQLLQALREKSSLETVENLTWKTA